MPEPAEPEAPRRRRRWPWKRAAQPTHSADLAPQEEAAPADEPDLTPDPSDAAPPKRSRAKRAAALGATAYRHRDLLVQALDLLRRARAISAGEQARLAAAYEEGTPKDRARLSEIVDRLQEANLGEVIIGLAKRVEGSDRDRAVQLLDDGKRALREAGHKLAEQGRRLLPDGKVDVEKGEELLRTGRKALRTETRALAREGRRLAQDYRQELQEFLDQNQPTVEAVERVSKDLAEAGRELASSLMFAGREAADELLKHGKKVITGFETADLEQAVLDEAIATIPRVRNNINRVLRWIGGFFVAMSLVMFTVWYPPLTPIALSAAGLLLLLLAIVIFGWKRDLTRTLTEAEVGLRRIEALPAGERRRRIVQHARQAMASTPPADPEASDAPAAGPIPVPIPPPVPERLALKPARKRARTQQAD